MFVIDVSPNSAVHLASSWIANRLVFLIFPLLRGADEREVALREAYAIAREEIEKFGAAASPCPVVAAGNRHARETIRGP
jgi:hypothetical protein